ncbi:hypothetical protein HMPREF9413_0251 [Paenibacillus sp. HGF7]|nr:hypothetical protein HMPREF9413_0251 [Paenibacillus sp. HGF7]
MPLFVKTLFSFPFLTLSTFSTYLYTSIQTLFDKLKYFFLA